MATNAELTLAAGDKAKPKTIGKKRGKSASSQYKWLLMVYMQAGDNSNLDSLAVQDLD